MTSDPIFCPLKIVIGEMNNIINTTMAQCHMLKLPINLFLLTNSVYLPRCDAETIHGASRGR